MTNEQVIAVLKNMIWSNNEHGNTLLCIGEVQALNMAIEALSVEVVRCRDCKLFEDGYCWFFDSVVDADGFCYKAKKDGDADD